MACLLGNLSNCSLTANKSCAPAASWASFDITTFLWFNLFEIKYFYYTYVHCKSYFVHFNWSFVAGVLANVQDMTIQDGGLLEVNEMIDIEGNAIEEIQFGSISIRTRGSMIARNAMRPRKLTGTDLRVRLSVVTSQHFAIKVA